VNTRISILQKLPLLLMLLLFPGIAAATHSLEAASFGDGVSKNAGCITCHGDKKAVDARVYIDPLKLGHTTHSRFGCTTCHDAITAAHPTVKSVARTTTCGDCHAAMTAEYARSPHSAKVSCGGCHNPHQVSQLVEVSGDDLNRQCTNCHSVIKITASHATWLPQTEIHLETVACVTCHSGAENFVVNLYIARKQDGREKLAPAGYEELQKLAGAKELQTLIDTNHDGYISLNELRIFNRNGVYHDYCLKTMLTPVKPTHDFKTFESRWNCTFCHGSGTQTMQTSFLSIPQKDGTYTRVAVEKGAVLDILNAIPDFYLTGAGRNALLNKIGLVIIAGGLIMPVGHGFLRFLSRKNRSDKGDRS
jgi:hypothetical protein